MQFPSTAPFSFRMFSMFSLFISFLLLKTNNLILYVFITKSSLQGFWQNPGGKVNSGETLIKAVQRETEEETGCWFGNNEFPLIDCFIYPERQLKTFLFEIRLHEHEFDILQNPEPYKQTNWELFTVKQALKLKLMPSVKYYLENLAT